MAEIKAAQDREAMIETFRLIQQEGSKNIQITTDVIQQQLEQQSRRQADAAERIQAQKEQEKNKFENRLSRASIIMKNLLFAMPTVSSEVPSYLQSMDNIFGQNNIDEDLRVSLLMPHLAYNTRRSILMLPPTETDTYEKWKLAVLKYHKLSPHTYRYNFENCYRTSSESCIQFTNRLLCLFKHYLQSRKVTTYDDLISLVVADRLKQSLSADVKYFVTDHESDDKWLKPIELANLVDLYQAERGTGNRGYYGSKGAYAGRNNDVKTYQQSNKDRMTCTFCLKAGHLESKCRQKEQGKPRMQKQVDRQIRTCFVCGSEKHISRDCPSRKEYKSNRVSVEQREVIDKADETDSKSLSTSRVVCQEELSKFNSTVNVKKPDSLSNDVFTLPENIKVTLDFDGKTTFAVLDTGTSISVLKSSMLPDNIWNEGFAPTQVSLQGAFGEKVQAKLVNVDCRLLSDNCVSNVVPITVAVTDSLARDEALLSLNDYEALVKGGWVVPKVEMLTNTGIPYSDPTIEGNQNSRRLETLTVLKESKRSSSKSDNPVMENLGVDFSETEAHCEFQGMQINDKTLKTCWDSCKKGNSEFFQDLDTQLLYRKTVISGLELKQLVLPTEKRQKVIEFAHDSQWAMHMGYHKTLLRIQAHFFWPGMTKDVSDYVRTCEPCQKHLYKKKSDRVPIVAVERANQAFQQVNIDLIGPINPKSSRGHSYVLCLIDSCTKWVEAVPLKTLTAKEACNALLLLFCTIGIPSILVSDNATNFSAQLARELHDRLGIELRYSSPLHPESNGSVERWNATLKRMLHHIVNSGTPRDWDKRLPFLLWAYREIPNATTGISPYQLVYGKIGRGPLAVLKESWTNEKLVLDHLNKPVQEYLEIVQRNLEAVSNVAQRNVDKAQTMYVENYNQSAKNKKFNVGDLVLVLLPSSTNKLLSTWQGPATVTACISSHSYRIALNNGAVRTLHANNLRSFNSRVDSVGIIFETDEEYGNVVPCPNVCNNFDAEIKSVDMSHLTDEQRSELCKLLFKYKAVFDDKPGSCKTACHEINLIEGFQPKKQYPYRIPDKLKAEVERQIDQLLLDQKIRPSNSVFSHPIVCVAKPNGEIRLCTDLRYVNSGTVNLPYPIPQTDHMLSKMAACNWITCLDCTSGFWQIPMKESDIYKTAMVTHHGLWEWMVMPFGCKTASQSFQRVMDDLLRPHSNYAHAYIDDTAVYSKSWKMHMIHLEKVLKAFLESGMTLKLSKCKFCQSQVKFVGHMVGSGTRTVVQSKIDAIMAIPEPQTKKLLRSFLGMCNFYRAYVPNYSAVAVELTNLTSTKCSNKIVFNDAQRAAFEKLKQCLCTATTLYAPDCTKPYIIRSDSSDYGVGATLSQIGNDGIEHPIAFASAKLNDTMRRYSVLEREAYAVLFALKKFDTMVYGCKIILYTDHNPLQYLAINAPKSAKLTRWSLSLTRYDITVRHINGKENHAADYLSRCDVSSVKCSNMFDDLMDIGSCNQSCCSIHVLEIGFNDACRKQFNVNIDDLGDDLKVLYSNR